MTTFKSVKNIIQKVPVWNEGDYYMEISSRFSGYAKQDETKLKGFSCFFQRSNIISSTNLNLQNGDHFS
jgi:hypothetical protein